MHDVIVAGAGPAGNMAALRLAEAGRDVLVLDWRHNIGDKLCTGIIGGSASSGSNPTLKRYSTRRAPHASSPRPARATGSSGTVPRRT